MKEAVYSKQTIEFVTVGVEYCAFIEKAGSYTRAEFADISVKLLPLLYLKATLLPQTQYEFTENLEQFVTEEIYEYVRLSLQNVMRSKDDYLEVFDEDMQYSDTPIATSVSENMTDIYQDIKDFVSIYKLGVDETMNDALALCTDNFKSYWGQKLVNVLRQLHTICYSDPSDDDDDDQLSGQYDQNTEGHNWLFEQRQESWNEDINTEEWNKWNE